MTNSPQRLKKGGSEVIVKRYASIACVACSLTLMTGGQVLADSVSISGTGADSTQQVTVDNTSQVDSTNTTNLPVTNTNVTQATTGAVDADSNTTVGGASSGPASNSASTATDLTVENQPAVLAAETTTTTSGGSGGIVAPVGGSGSANAGVSVGNPEGSGSVLGASTTPGRGGASAILPVTGASSPIDVSALRNAWHPAVSAPIAALTKSSQMFSTAMFATAALLSILGGIGSAWYAKRREERV